MLNEKGKMTNDKKGAHIFHLSLIISHLAQRFFSFIPYLCIQN